MQRNTAPTTIKNECSFAKVPRKHASPPDSQDPNQVRCDVSADGRVNASDLSRIRPRRPNDARGIPDPIIPGAAFVEEDGLVVMEAEDYHDKVSQGGHEWELVAAPVGYSGDGAAFIAPNVRPPRLSYR